MPLDLELPDPIVRGTQIGGATVEKLAAQGGMGVVYRAHDTDTGAQRAVKVMHTSMLPVDGAAERFHREAQILLQLRHPNVVACHEVGVLPDGRPYLVLEWLEGPTLAEVLKVRRQLSLAEALPILEQLCAGLQAAHDAGIVHRDVKPQNLVLTAGGLKLVDFGIARPQADELPRLTATGLSVGTPSFMAPEQILAGRVGPAADLYAVGLVAYLTLCGRHPFDVSSVSEMEAAHLHLVPPAPGDLSLALADLDPVLLRSLEKQPWRRHSDARSFAADLRRVADRPDGLEALVVPALGIEVTFAGDATEVERERLREAFLDGGLQLAIDNDTRMIAATPLPYARTEAHAARARLGALALEVGAGAALREAPARVLRIGGIDQIIDFVV